MKKRKNYGRKIKRNKINLYPKKKTRAQKILGTVLLVVIILAVVFLGYCLGKPLLDFIEKSSGQNENSPAWTPPADTSQSVADEIPENTGDTAETTQTSSTEADTTAPPEAISSTNAVYVPVSALSNSASLSTFASKSAAEGYNTAVVSLKNSGGYLLYRTETDPAKDSEAVIGMMTASEIAAVLKQNGLVPVGEISILSDNEGGKINGDMCYKIVDEPTVSWLDYFSTGEPLRWSDPSSEAAVSYNKAIIDELKTAGFEKIIQTDIIFPPFQEYDREYIAARYFAADRFKMLSAVVADGSLICINADDIILNNMSGSAEVLKNKDKLSENTVIIHIDKDVFASAGGYPADASALLEDIMSQCGVKCGGLKLVPMIEKSDFAAEEIDAMKKTAEKLNFDEFYVK